LRKVAYILIIAILTVGCSASRKVKRKNISNENLHKYDNTYHGILNQNITARSFYVERADFKIKSEDGEKSGFGTIKFLMPDRFLISLKSNTGIEIARIFISGDSIKINDRIDKKTFYGSTSFLKKKYGLTTSILPVILGDYVNDMNPDSVRINCIDGKSDVEGTVKDVRINYLIDCEKGKSVVTEPDKNANEYGLQIKYSDFFVSGDINIPGNIEISDNQRNTTIEIRIQRIVIPWEGTIEFIPGKQYEKINLR